MRNPTSGSATHLRRIDDSRLHGEESERQFLLVYDLAHVNNALRVPAREENPKIETRRNLFMREELEKLVISGKIGSDLIDPILLLSEAGYSTHRSWGFGKITEIDTVFSRISIDFDTKPDHSMDLGFAAKTLNAIGPEHILARKVDDLKALQKLAAINHLELIKVVLLSYNGKATIDTIQKSLVPEVIEEDWKKWWDTAKRELKKSGHFRVPSKKSQPVEFHEEEVKIDDRLLSDFEVAKGLKQKLAVVSEVLKLVPDLHNKKAVATIVLAVLNDEIPKYLKNQPSLVLEAVFARDELSREAELEKQDEEVTEAVIWERITDIVALFEALPAAKFKPALLSLKKSKENWPEIVLDLMNHSTVKLAGDCALLMINNDLLDDLKKHLAYLINQQSAKSDLLLWLAKSRSDTFADILDAEVFNAMLTAMEHDQFQDKKINRLGDFILSDKNLLVELIDSADIEVVKDITRKLKFSPVFEDMEKRSLLARIVKAYTSVQSLISKEKSSQDNSLVVSWKSLERRKSEYEKLVHKKIPDNSKEIAIARSYGDLRENHEYKAAKEQQKFLMKRKAELERDLLRAKGTDFANVNTDVVTIGTRIDMTNLDTQATESYAILGAWDSAPDENVMSYLTPMAQAVINHKSGDEVEFEMGSQKQRYRIDSIDYALDQASDSEENQEEATSA